MYPSPPPQQSFITFTYGGSERGSVGSAGSDANKENLRNYDWIQDAPCNINFQLLRYYVTLLDLVTKCGLPTTRHVATTYELPASIETIHEQTSNKNTSTQSAEELLKIVLAILSVTINHLSLYCIPQNVFSGLLKLLKFTSSLGNKVDSRGYSEGEIFLMTLRPDILKWVYRVLLHVEMKSENSEQKVDWSEISGSSSFSLREYFTSPAWVSLQLENTF